MDGGGPRGRRAPMGSRKIETAVTEMTDEVLIAIPEEGRTASRRLFPDILEQRAFEPTKPIPIV